MKRDFLWGAALSNVQAEGAYLEDGKGLNVYDTLVVTPEKGIVPMACWKGNTIQTTRVWIFTIIIRKILI